jgi:hypothetical protein
MDIVLPTPYSSHTQTPLRRTCVRDSQSYVSIVFVRTPAVVWLQTTLTPNLTDEEATEHFEGLITQALSERRDRVFRDLAHIWAHGK